VSPLPDGERAGGEGRKARSSLPLLLRGSQRGWEIKSKYLTPSLRILVTRSLLPFGEKARMRGAPLRH